MYQWGLVNERLPRPSYVLSGKPTSCWTYIVNLQTAMDDVLGCDCCMTRLVPVLRMTAGSNPVALK